ncbi:MAG: DUF3179 domain-containing protein [Rhodothermales bacterium]|nr:DUF3179 domain-containing protein [Rhodothermales bacterium]
MPNPVERYALFLTFTAVVVTVGGLFVSTASAQSDYPSGWETDWENRSVDLSEIMSGGVPRDGIPSIDAPRFVSIDAAGNWLGDREPVIMLQTGASARAYPLQIMTYHEIVNDELGGVPVVVTFCPLCYSAIAYRRTVGEEVYEFGVSGMLRHSDLIMYDRQTESLWQQIDGEAIVGDLTGTLLEPLPAQIVSFAQFAARFAAGSVLSRETGHVRNYGTNPYRGYDDIDERPFLFRGDIDDRLPPMEKVVALSLGGVKIAYPHSVTRDRGVINDVISDVPLAVFHVDGAVTALGDAVIRDAEIIGTTGVFDRRVDGRTLSFEFKDGSIRDAETGSVWDVTGHAISGSLVGRSLQPIVHGNYFSFAWFAFQPGSRVYR